MSKIVFLSIPAYGHTNPTLGVVRELLARGHQVWYYSYSPMEQQIRQSGAQFVSCDAYDPQLHLSEADSARLSSDLAFSTHLITEMTLALDSAILRDMEALAPDCIVGDSVAFWAKLIAQKLDIPYVCSCTTFAFNCYSAHILPQQGSLFSLLKALLASGKDCKRLRARGYPVKNALSIISNSNDTRTIVYTSPQLQPCAETFSDLYHFVGVSLRPVEEPLPASPLPTLFISLGTVLNRQPQFYRRCLEALGGQNLRVLMAVGSDCDPAELGTIPENFLIRQRFDQLAALQVSQGFLTHCGMNSVNEALHFGVPLLLYPQTPEQAGVATRVEQLGAGFPLGEVSVENLRRSVERLLSDASLRQKAQQLSQGFQALGGAKAAADVIEEAVQTK